MVSEMENIITNSEEARSSSVGATSSNCARQSPKLTASVLPVPSPSASLLRNPASPTVPKKIISKNNNNTMFPTTFPNNLAELQLYRVMQNASLLYYYDTLLEMGGDDVQQLCDAGEEEFLEIMSLVGMASKPLHVRRLQKSLQEWVTNPAKFKSALVPGEDFEIELSSPRVTGGYYSIESGESTRTLYSPSSAEALTPSPGLSINNKRPYSPLDTPSCPPSSSSSPGSSSSSHTVTTTLLESQINKLAIAAERLSKHLPQFEPKPQNTKKKMCKELELVMSMPDTDPRRMDEIRRYAAIYGRFDCKRRPEKPLTLHEISVNEAAAQICRCIPALLTRRDELFPLARQVVKDSGCHYSKTHYGYLNKHPNHDRELLDIISNSGRAQTRLLSSDGELPFSKRQKYDPESEHDEGLKRQDRNDENARPLLLYQQRSQQNHREKNLIIEDETDSHFSFSNSSSPSQSTAEEQDHNEDSNHLSPKVQVIAASGNNIIAVANPALAMSPAIMPLTIEKGEHKITDQ